MSSALQVEPDIGLRELLEISNSNDWSVQYSPFLNGPGGQIGGTIIRQASPIKGKTKREGEDFEDYKERLSDMGYGDIADGLESAVEMAEEQEDNTGVALVQQDGQMKIMSQAAADLAAEGKKGAQVLERTASYNEAVDALATRGGQAHLPTVA